MSKLAFHVVQCQLDTGGGSNKSGESSPSGETTNDQVHMGVENVVRAQLPVLSLTDRVCV